jgi:hypothetical protein
MASSVCVAILSVFFLMSPAAEIQLSLEGFTWQGWIPFYPVAPVHPSGAPPICEMWSITDIFFGTPPQPLKLMVDSGSSSLLVYTERCAACANASWPSFNISSSHTYEKSSGAVKLDYGGASYTASQSSDVLLLNSTNGTVVTVDDFKFFSVLSLAPAHQVPLTALEAMIPSGISGVAMGTAPLQLVHQLYLRGLIPSEIVGLSFGVWNDREGQFGPGKLCIGSLDERVFYPPLVWDNSSAAYVSKLRVNGTIPSVNSCDLPNGCAPTIDTGAGLLSLPQGTIWSIGTDCSGLEQLPTFSFVLLEALEMVIKPEDYILRTVSNKTGQHSCASAIAQVACVAGGGFAEFPDATNSTSIVLAGRFFALTFMAVTPDSNGYARRRNI